MATRTFTTKDGRRVKIRSKKRGSSGKYRNTPLGSCVDVPTGKGGKCTIRLCHSGKGATGWTFVKGTKRCPGGIAGVPARKRRRAKRRQAW